MGSGLARLTHRGYAARAAYVILAGMTPSGEAPATQAVRRLLAEFGPRLRAIVSARCPNDTGVDPDAVERAVRLRLEQALARQSAVAHPASQVYRTTMSVIVEHLRRRRGPPDLDAGETIEPATRLPVAADDDIAANAELARVLAAVLEALPERQRRPVQLHLQGFGFVEVARLLGLSEAAARLLVHRGMEEICDRLRAQGWP